MIWKRDVSSSIVSARQVVTETMIAEIGKDHLQVQRYLTSSAAAFLIFLHLTIADQNIRMPCSSIQFWTHCGETYFMALRPAIWDRQTNTPHPSEAEKRRTERKH